MRAFEVYLNANDQKHGEKQNEEKSHLSYQYFGDCIVVENYWTHWEIQEGQNDEAVFKKKQQSAYYFDGLIKILLEGQKCKNGENMHELKQKHKVFEYCSPEKDDSD